MGKWALYFSLEEAAQMLLVVVSSLEHSLGAVISYKGDCHISDVTGNVKG